MESLREANEMADEPHEIALIVKDCADGSADEDHTKEWLGKTRESIEFCRELLEAVGVEE